tara:strand:- start:464 stop:1018 length:555 start_codon:yes stop_codon:yes gene_type:complete
MRIYTAPQPKPSIPEEEDWFDSMWKSALTKGASAAASEGGKGLVSNLFEDSDAAAGAVAEPSTDGADTGAAVGSVAGGAAGSFFGPAGSAAGAALGSMAGDLVGGLFDDDSSPAPPQNPMELPVFDARDANYAGIDPNSPRYLPAPQLEEPTFGFPKKDVASYNINEQEYDPDMYFNPYYNNGY